MHYAAGVVAALLILMATAMARAEGELQPPIPNAEEIMTGCRTLSKQKALEVTGRYRDMEYKREYTNCLEENIKENMRILFLDRPMKNGQTLEQMITVMRESFTTIYDEIFTCNDICGSTWESYADAAIAGHYEEVLKTVLMRRHGG